MYLAVCCVFPHVLHDARQWIEFGADQSYHELVVMLIQSEASHTDVVGIAGFGIGASHHAVLRKNFPLVGRREEIEFRFAAQRVPDRPAQRRIEDIPTRFDQQPVLKIGFTSC